MLNYETEWMSRDELVAATYEAAFELNRLKARYWRHIFTRRDIIGQVLHGGIQRPPPCTAPAGGRGIILIFTKPSFIFSSENGPGNMYAPVLVSLAGGAAAVVLGLLICLIVGITAREK